MVMTDWRLTKKAAPLICACRIIFQFENPLGAATTKAANSPDLGLTPPDNALQSGIPAYGKLSLACPKTGKEIIN